jgi:hypothetical protein
MNLDQRLSGLDTRLTGVEGTIGKQSLHLATNCSGDTYTQCICDAGEIAISGGTLPTTTSGVGYTVESRNVGPGAVPGTTWVAVCKDNAGNPIKCAQLQVYCARIK